MMNDEQGGHMTNGPDERELERTIKAVYRNVAAVPDGEFPFETGRELAERLGYPPADLNRIPSEAVDAFAGVGYHLDLAALSAGDDALDLGSGSGTDAFVAALHTGPAGRVSGIDFTAEQLTRSRRLRDRDGFGTVAFGQGYVEELPFENDAFDVVLSNGALTLSARKEQVVREARRVVKPNGRLAISDIVTEEELPRRIKTDVHPWSAYVGGAMHVTAYVDALEAAGFEVIELRENPQYRFHAERVRNTARKYGMKSVSLAARKR